MGPNVTRLFFRRNAALRTPQEREVVRVSRAAFNRGDLIRRVSAAEANVAALIAAVRADPRDPFRSADDETIAAEILRRLGPGNNGP